MSCVTRSPVSLSNFPLSFCHLRIYYRLLAFDIPDQIQVHLGYRFPSFIPEYLDSGFVFLLGYLSILLPSVRLCALSGIFLQNISVFCLGIKSIPEVSSRGEEQFLERKGPLLAQCCFHRYHRQVCFELVNVQNYKTVMFQ